MKNANPWSHFTPGQPVVLAWAARGKGDCGGDDFAGDVTGAVVAAAAGDGGLAGLGAPRPGLCFPGRPESSSWRVLSAANKIRQG